MEEEINTSQVLNQIWNNAGKPGAFSSARKLWRVVHEKGYSITLPEVQSWLNKQKGYLANKYLPETPIKKGIASRHLFPSVGTVAADIMYLTHFQKGATQKYMLITVECLTGFTAVSPLSAITSKNVFRAFIVCLELFRTPVYTVLTDNGKEFLGKFHEGVRNMKLHHSFTSVYSQHKTVQAEKMIRFIRLRTSMYLKTNPGGSLINAILNIVASHNQEKRPALGFLSPIEVDRSNYLIVQEHFAVAKQLRDESNLKKNFYPAKFHIGDKVYIRENLDADKFRKAGQSRYMKDPCIIVKVVDTEPLHSYQLKSISSGLNLVGYFQENRLIPASDLLDNDRTS